MDNFLLINSNGTMVWWLDMQRFIEDMNAALALMRQALEPTVVALASWGNTAIRLMPPERRLNAIEQECAFREYAEHYNARHPSRRISWRRLNRHQRAEAALDYLATEPPPD